MKLFKLMTLFCFAVVISSCSNSDDNNNNLPVENSFSVTVDGVAYTFTAFQALKANDNYEVLGSNDNQDNFYLRFNENGVLDRASFYSTNLDNLYNYNSSYYFAKKEFNLTNVSIDPNSMVVAGLFDGSLFDDDVDVTSPSVEASNGAFNLVFTDSEFPFDQFIDATINGEPYESIKAVNSGGFGGDPITHFGVSDGEIIIGIKVDLNNLQQGTFNFSDANTQINSVIIQRNDPFVGVFEESLDSSGTLVIDEVTEDDFSRKIIKGTFSASATDIDNNTLTIENGSFSILFQ